MLNKKTILIIAAVAVVAFMFGALLSGNDQPSVNAEEEHDHSDKSQIWTCSMHPQIQLPEPGKCPICFMDLIPLEENTDELAPNQIKLSEAAIALAKIQTSEVIRQSAEHQINLPGKVVVDQDNMIDITARYEGRIDKLYVTYPGEKVKQNQKLALVYSPQIIALHDEMIQSKKLLENNSNQQSLVASSARQTIESAREKLRLYGITPEQIEALYNMNEVIEHINILASRSGTVLNVNVKDGSYLKVGTKLMSIADLRHLWVEFEAYESDLAWLKNNQTVTFTINSLPGETFEGRIIFIDSKIDPIKRTTNVRIAVDNKSGVLKPDMLASGIVMVGNDQMNQNDLLIPASAPLITGKRAVVYLETKKEDGAMVYEGRQISLGPKAGDFYIVKSGLEAGERVVTNGAFKIDSELQIQAKPSMMSPDGQAGSVHAQHTTSDAMKSEDKNSEMNMSSANDNKKESLEAVQALTPVYNAYFETQMALANDDLETALAGYQNVNQEVKDVPMNVFSESGHMRWMDYYRKLLASSEAGEKSDNIESARIYFQDLSNTMIELEKDFGHADDVVYYLTFCPMAFNNTGAYWLQTEKIIWNSYWGERMLRCGSIEDTLKAMEK